MATGICDQCPEICTQTDNLINVVTTDINTIIDTINLSVSNALAGSLDRSTYYQYIPMLLFFLAFIWILVYVGVFNWILGLLLSVAIVILVFLFLIAFRSTLLNYLDTLYANTKQSVSNEINQLQSDAQASYREVLTAIENCSDTLGTTGGERIKGFLTSGCCNAKK